MTRIVKHSLNFPCILRTNRVSEIIKTIVKEDKVTEKLKITYLCSPRIVKHLIPNCRDNLKGKVSKE